LMGKLPPGDEVEGSNLRRLLAHRWPGNVRELRNVLLRAVTMSEATTAFEELLFDIEPDYEPSTLGLPYPGIDQPLPFKEAKRRLLTSFQRAYVDALLHRHDGNLSRAAKEAELSRKHLYQLLRKVDENE
ncbi:MAG: Fis family transcriptional regulator, partial [Myxococcota bacterium]